MDFLYQYDPVRDTSPVRILSGGGDFGGTLSRYDINNAYRDVISSGYEGSVSDFTRLLSNTRDGKVSYWIDVENTISYEQIMYYKLLFSEFSALGFIPELIKASKKITFDFDGYDWGRTGKILDVGGYVYTGLEKLTVPGYNNYFLGINGKYYNKHPNGFTGSRLGAIKAARWYKVGGVATTLLAGGIEIVDGAYQDGWEYGYNAQKATASAVVGGLSGWGAAALGAKGGAALGTLICPGIGTAIGAAVGGIGCGFLGSWGGSWIGTTTYDSFAK